MTATPPSVLTSFANSATEGDDIFEVTQWEVKDRIFDGLGGTDEFKLVGGGHFDLSRAAKFANFETITGSDQRDTFVVNANQLTSVHTIHAGGLSDFQDERLYIYGAAIDLRNVLLVGIDRIVLHDVDAVITTNKIEYALAIEGTHCNNETVVVTGATLSQQQRDDLRSHGIDNLVDGSGSVVLNKAPQLTGIAGVRVKAFDKVVTRLDAGGSFAALDDHGEIRSLSLVVKEAYASYSELLGITATDRVSLVKNGNTTAISVDGRLVAQGSTFVALNVYTGFSIGFQDATSEEVTQVLRALTYTVNHYGTADRYGRPESTRSIEISIVDGGSRTAKATILVDKQPIAPVGQTLTGTAASDKIVGAFGNDRLSGKLGNDVLTGDKGKDIFIFDTKAGKRNVDKITDFNIADDSIHLENSIFKTLGKKPGMLKKAAFWVGAKAHDASDRIVYDKKIGALYYDEDGSGRKAAVKFATINKVGLNEKDFFIV